MPRKKAEAPKVSETKKKPVAKKPTVKKPVATKKPTTRKKTTTKPKEPVVKWKEISQDELHPHEGFPYRLEYKDGNENRICHFECEDHRTKHITRYKLNPKTIRLNYKYDD